MKTSIDNLTNNISKIIDDFSSNVKSKSEECLNETADKIIDYIKLHAPIGKSSEHLKDSFIKTEVGSGANKIIYISSSTKGRLVHLIELGFKHRSGVHVAAHPFMRPAYDIFTPTMLEEIKKIINGG